MTKRQMRKRIAALEAELAEIRKPFQVQPPAVSLSLNREQLHRVLLQARRDADLAGLA